MVRPLVPLRRIGYGDRIEQLWEKAVKLAGNQEPTAEDVKHVVSEFRREVGVKAIKSAQRTAKITELRDRALADLKMLYQIEGSETAQQVIDDFVKWANEAGT